MKKNSWLLTPLVIIIGLALTGCGQQTTPISESNNLNNNQTSRSTSTKIISEDETSMNTTTVKTLPDHEDLFKTYKQAVIKTNYGDITVELFGDESPVTVNNFLNLAQEGFYNKTKFHRVIKDFMIQGGDPNSKDDDWSNDGMGGPAYKFKDEFNNKKLVRGSLAMANSGPNTNGSQFFIVTKEETPWLDGKHTNFGQVVAGMNVVVKIEDSETNENDHPIKDAIIESIELK